MKKVVGIIGLGLIGGSLALDLRSKGYAQSVLGVDASKVHLDKALSLKLIDKAVGFNELMDSVDIIIIATPVSYVDEILNKVLDIIKPNQTVFDVGSTKEQIILSVKNHVNRGQFVACHPMAGTEFSGPEAAINNLFGNKINVICNQEESSIKCMKEAQGLFDAIGMRNIFQNAKDHDVHAAYVSHISHISSFALALTVLEKEKDEGQIFDLASGGFASTVRLAKSSPDTWGPIFEQNRDNVLDVLDEHINVLSSFRTLLIKKDFNKFNGLMEKANDIKRILKIKKD